MYCFRLIKLTLIRSEIFAFWKNFDEHPLLQGSTFLGLLQMDTCKSSPPQHTNLSKHLSNKSWQFLVPSLSIRKVPNVSWLFFGAFDIRITPTCSHGHGFLITFSVIICKLLLTRAFFPCDFGALSYVQHQLGPSSQRLLQGKQKYTGEHQKYIYNL